ncbi:MAG: hypothetical protein JWQ40_5204, partial [Segetibacter sp.]|nr:hypothetical protein [Segetibacter sp.]
MKKVFPLVSNYFFAVFQRVLQLSSNNVGKIENGLG